MNLKKVITTVGLALNIIFSTEVYADNNLQWGVMVHGSNPAPIFTPPTVYTPPVAVNIPPPRPIAPPLPKIEPIQADQYARIRWGIDSGLISQREFYRLDALQQAIEEQRRRAYADGWLTYPEHLEIIQRLNAVVPEIESALMNGQRIGYSGFDDDNQFNYNRHDQGHNHGKHYGRGKGHWKDNDDDYRNNNHKDMNRSWFHNPDSSTSNNQPPPPVLSIQKIPSNSAGIKQGMVGATPVPVESTSVHSRRNDETSNNADAALRRMLLKYHKE